MEAPYYTDAFPCDEKAFFCQQLSKQLISTSNSHNYNEKIKNLLMQYPYPSLQLIQGSGSRQWIESIIGEVLQHLLNDNAAETNTKLVSIVANVLFSTMHASILRETLVDFIANRTQTEFWLALLSRPDALMLDAVLSVRELQLHRPQLSDVFNSKEFVLYNALKQRRHFVPMLSLMSNEFENLTNVGIRSNLLVLKIVNEYARTSNCLTEINVDVKKWLDALNQQELELPLDLQEIHKLFYIDFMRLSLVTEFLKKFPDTFKTITIDTLLNSNGVLRLLFDYDINSSFEETRHLIQSLYKCEHHVLTKGLLDLEMETLTYYFGLATAFDVILVDSTLTADKYFVSKMQKLHYMMRQMRNIDVLCSFLEDIFQLVFLRWENIDPNKTIATTETNINRSKLAKSSSNNSTDIDHGSQTPSPMIISAVAGSSRHGFICRGRALQHIFNFLKSFVTKKLHSEEYKNASERIQMRFQRIVEIVTEALWKYSVIEKIDDSIACSGGAVGQQFILDAEELLQLVQMHANSTEKSSSDDESNRDRCNYTSLTRRKASKKRRRATLSGPVTTQANATLKLEECRTRPNVMALSFNEAQNADNVSCLKTRYMFSSLKGRSIIPRMLGSPENLAIMALSINNFNDVKYIIGTFNLHNTELDHELSFVEQQQQVKKKLASIYEHYQIEERNSGGIQEEPKATVEQIKNVVAKGFEASKIISVIDNFAQFQKIKQPEEIKCLLMKHASNSQYCFMRQFEEGNLNAIIVTDLILNLHFNHEITTNILMVIKRQQQLGAKAPFKSATPNRDPNMKQQLPSDIGCTRLLENLCQCMSMLENVSLRDLLSDNYYSLKPPALARELKRESAFKALFSCNPTESGRNADHKDLTQGFQFISNQNNYYARFTAYVNQFSKLLQLRNKNCTFHTNELLKFDPGNIIGELLFECNITPLEIEANVAALNLNLVHVIALNICPEIVGKSAATSTAKASSKMKQQTILNYIMNHNRLLAYLLECIDRSTQLSFNKNMEPEVLQRFLKLNEIKTLAQLYDNNILISALHADCVDMKRLTNLNSKSKQLEILLLKIGNQETNNDISMIIDTLIVDLIREDSKHIYLAVHIHNIALKATLIHENFTKIATTRLAKELIESTLQHQEALTRIPSKLRLQLENTLADITVYAKVSDVLQFESWPQAYDFGLKTPASIFEKLLDLRLYKLCYQWCKIVKLADRFAPQKRVFFSAMLKAMLSFTDPQITDIYLLRIMETFSTEDCCGFLHTHKDSFRSIDLLKYVIKFLAKNSKTFDNYKNYKISLVIFEQLNQEDREQFWNVLKYPLLIIEQVIMNARFEILTKVLKAVRSSPHMLGEKSANMQNCAFCFDKRGHIYDIQMKSNSHSKNVHFQLGSDAASAGNSIFILLNFNLYQKNHVISNECVDLLLRIYATKALDYQMTSATNGTDRSQSTDMQQSLDSLCGAFQMPRVAPTREEWVNDDAAAHCMCCRRAVFTMLMRRHHCRRCGRVVCFACSTHRMHIPNLYADVEVRICNDCHSFTEEEIRKSHIDFVEQTPAGGGAVFNPLRDQEQFKWKLSGNITHDKLVREEFCYDHAPSVALCLTILSHHLDQKKCVDLLLHHCGKLEKLIAPNPEVDFELISKMINCLALAAKVRGGSVQIETVCEHSELIMSLTHSGCESLVPVGPLTNHSIRTLADSLVQAEKWELALDVHLKYGLSTAGVMAAHGLSCLRAGCFDTAREKLFHCMPKQSNELLNSKILNFIMTPAGSDSGKQILDFSKGLNSPATKRIQRGPALLIEILKIIEYSVCAKPQPETLRRASIIRNSNSSLSSMLSRRKDAYIIPMHEPAINILTTLANLKRLSKGNYNEGHLDKTNNRQYLLRQSRGFEEAMHYVLSYGSNSDIIQFLMRHQEITAALKYFAALNLDADLFIHNIFLVSLRCGEVPSLISKMMVLDSGQVIWHDVLIQTCRYLENKNLMHSLYQLQILLKDPIRASMTCVKFYSINCDTFQQLHNNAHHLFNAKKHLLLELDQSQWHLEKIKKPRDSLVRRSSVSSRGADTSGYTAFPMQMDARLLNSHINTIIKQLDVAKFLADCETRVGDANDVMKILKQIRVEGGTLSLPTLFDSSECKIEICTLILLAGKNIDEGFGLSYRIIQYYKLPSLKIFGSTARYLARNKRISEVDKLLNCITTNTGPSNSELDDILSIAIHSATGNNASDVKVALDGLVHRIHNIDLRITCHMFMGQLKSAYLLANKYERLGEIRKILRQAEVTNQVHIKKLCEKKLGAHQTI